MISYDKNIGGALLSEILQIWSFLAKVKKKIAMAKTSTFLKILQSEKNHCEANIVALLAWDKVQFGSHAWQK